MAAWVSSSPAHADPPQAPAGPAPPARTEPPQAPTEPAPPARAEPAPPAAADDDAMSTCTQPAPGRVPLLISVGDRQTALKPTSAQSRQWEIERPGVGCHSTCEGSCTLQVEPGDYSLTWGSARMHLSDSFRVGPTGTTVTMRGNETVSLVALTVGGLGALVEIITVLVGTTGQSGFKTWSSPSTVTLLASTGVAVTGLVTGLITLPRLRAEPYSTPSGAGAAGQVSFGAAPLLGGALVSGAVRF